MDWEIYQALLLALGLGALVGLQREYQGSEIAGIRTFPLLTMLGTITAIVGGLEGLWLVASGLLSIALILVIANYAKVAAHGESSGITTEVAVLLMYCIGAALGYGYFSEAILVSGVAAVLLHWKRPLHRIVDRIGEKDFHGLIQLVLIALVILPLLPDETYGPYDVFNPYKIWLMVVLIVGISLVAYVAYKLLGASAGAILGGVLGGLISSTATTVSYARQTKDAPDLSPVAAMVVLIASTIVNVRVLVEVGVVSRELLSMTVLPLAILLLVMTVECVVLFVLMRKNDVDLPEHDNPAQLKPAIIFGILYAVILFVVAWAKDQFGSGALYGVAVISGLTDVDAITLSTANLFQSGRVEATVAWRVILIATLSNLVFKASAVVVLGSRKLALYTVVTFGIALVAGIGILFFWPDIVVPIPYSAKS